LLLDRCLAKFDERALAKREYQGMKTPVKTPARKRKIEGSLIERLDWRSKCAVGIVIAGLATCFLSLQPFTFGYWHRAEPLVVWLHAVSACATLLLIFTWDRDRAFITGILRHPFVLFPAAMGAWSLVVSAMAPFPMVSIFGAPQSGQGALWYWDIAVLTAVAMMIVERRRAWRTVTIAALAITVLLSICILLSAYFPALKVLPVPDFYGYFALALPFMARRYCDQHVDILLFRLSWVAAVAILIASSNAAAIALLAIIGAAFLVQSRFQEQPLFCRVTQHRGVASALVTTAFVAPYLAITQIPLLSRIASLKSRDLLWDLMKDAQNWDFTAIFFGHGWGHTQVDFFLHLNATSATVWQLDWDFLSRDFFHSHNALVESLYTTGLPGVFLLFAMLVAIPVFAPSERRFAATVCACVYGAMNAVWFELAVSIPFYIVAVVSFAEINRTPLTLSAAGKALRVAALALLVCAQVGAAVILLRFGLAVSAVQAAYQGLGKNRELAVAFPKDIRSHELSMALSLRQAFEKLHNPASGALAVDRTGRERVTRWMIDDLKARIPSSQTPVLILTGVSLLSDIYYSPKLSWMGAAYEQEEKTWGAWITRLLRLAPKRSDAAVPYFSWLLKHHRSGDLIAFCREILRKNSDDPVALFYAGAVLSTLEQESAKEMGLGFINAALDGGIERIMPVPAWLKTRAKRGFPPKNTLRALAQYFD
jgi:hypothetical protein